MKEVFYLLLIFFGLIMFYNVCDTYGEMKSNVGEHVLLEGDTLLITDFNSCGCSYQLSNGVSIYKNFGEEIIIK